MTPTPWRTKRLRDANTFIAQYQIMADIEFEYGEPKRILISRDQDFTEFFVGITHSTAGRWIESYDDPELTANERMMLDQATGDDLYDRVRSLPVEVI